MVDDARVSFTQTLKGLGFTESQINELLPQVTQWQSVYTPTQIVTDLLPTTTVYKQRFVANEARIRNGLRPLSPSEYIATEESYRATLKDAGLPIGFYDSPDDFAGFIGQNTSPSEMKTRVDTAAQAVNNADPTYVRALQDMYGIDPSMLAAYMLDANRALPLIEKQAKAIEFGYAAAKQGLKATTFGEQFATQGPTTGYSAEQGYSAIAGMLPTASKLGQVYGETYDQATAEQEVFSGLESAKRKRQKLGEMETATFSGQSGVAAGSLKTSKSGQFQSQGVLVQQRTAHLIQSKTRRNSQIPHSAQIGRPVCAYVSPIVKANTSSPACIVVRVKPNK